MGWTWTPATSARPGTSSWHQMALDRQNNESASNSCWCNALRTRARHRVSGSFLRSNRGLHYIGGCNRMEGGQQHGRNEMASCCSLAEARVHPQLIGWLLQLQESCQPYKRGQRTSQRRCSSLAYPRIVPSSSPQSADDESVFWGSALAQRLQDPLKATTAFTTQMLLHRHRQAGKPVHDPDTMHWAF